MAVRCARSNQRPRTVCPDFVWYGMGTSVWQLGISSSHYELIYDFRRGQALVCIRVRLADISEQVPSLAAICPCAKPFEDSFAERYGLTFG
jgi:Ni,Fe-hydrogenase III component G